MRAISCPTRRAAPTRIARSGGALALILLCTTFAGCGDEPTAPRAASRAPRAPRADAGVPSYDLQLLPTPPGSPPTVVGINDDGAMVGIRWNATDGHPSMRWLPDGTMDWVPLDWVRGIMNDGTVGGNVGCNAALWHPASGVTKLTADPANPSQCAYTRGMSPYGALWGDNFQAWADQRWYVFMRTPSGGWSRTILAAPPGYRSMWVTYAHPAYGIVGRLIPETGPYVAFHWTPTGGAVPLVSGLATMTSATAIGANGEILGYRAVHDGSGVEVRTPVRFEAGGLRDLDAEGSGEVVAVNARGDILVNDRAAPRVLLASGTVVPLPLLGNGASDVTGINGNGWVVGHVRDESRVTRPVRWGPPLPFVVSAHGPYSANEGQLVSLAGSVTAGGASPFSWRWDFGDGGWAPSQGILHAYADDGTFRATFSATDATGRTATDTATVVIRNVAPYMSVLSAGPGSFESGGEFSVLARFGDAGIRDAPWTLTLEALPNGPEPGGERVVGSGSTSISPPTSISGSVQLLRAGSYSVLVSLRDSDGGSVYAGTTYSVWVNRRPVPMTAASTGGELLATTLAGSASVPAAGVALATVRLGDGVVQGVPIATGADGRPIASVHDATGDGVADLVIAFRWADLEASGALSVPARGLVLRGDLTGGRQFEGRAPVPPRPPVVTVGGPYVGTEGAPIAFAATAAGGTAPLTLKWSFGDGVEATTLAPTHAYADDGTYTVSFTATDAAGHAATGTTTATIANAPPVLTLGPGATIFSGETFTARGHVTDPGAADAPWRWTVQWPQGVPEARGELAAVPGAFAATAVLRRAGTALVAVRVFDADGSLASATVPVVVQRLPVPMAVSPSRIHPAERGKGLLTVTLTRTERVSVDDIDVSSVRLNGVPVDSRGDGVPHDRLKVWNAGESTLVLKFRRDALAGAGPMASLVLHADLRDGRQVEARYTLLP